MMDHLETAVGDLGDASGLFSVDLCMYKCVIFSL